MEGLCPDKLCGALQTLFSREGVVKETGICSACFLRKQQRCGEYPLSLLTTFAASSPKGEQAPARSAALSQKAALQMQFGVTTPLRENSVWSAPQSATNAKL